VVVPQVSSISAERVATTAAGLVRVTVTGSMFAAHAGTVTARDAITINETAPDSK
jgi:hypothetical protein